MPGHVVLMVDAACEHDRAESKGFEVGDKGEHNFHPPRRAMAYHWTI